MRYWSPTFIKYMRVNITIPANITGKGISKKIQGMCGADVNHLRVLGLKCWRKNLKPSPGYSSPAWDFFTDAVLDTGLVDPFANWTPHIAISAG